MKVKQMRYWNLEVKSDSIGVASKESGNDEKNIMLSLSQFLFFFFFVVVLNKL
ncbi:hypothetical protein L195_g062243 [Trifolium pratense]|uniref:Uncharacterized protein n=1 Tax=Trifolium pratense TaxID=57577 RepID=A0A2K3KEI4_TRIPR|nr:hypothetical protein L195_g062243 [Trifolium pratense]